MLDKSFGLESMPPPHCLKWGYGHLNSADEVKACAKKALDGQALPGLGTKYVLATIMAEIGPQTIIAVVLDPPGWVVLSCDPNRPCPPRKRRLLRAWIKMMKRFRRGFECRPRSSKRIPKSLSLVHTSITWGFVRDMTTWLIAFLAAALALAGLGLRRATAIRRQ